MLDLRVGVIFLPASTQILCTLGALQQIEQGILQKRSLEMHGSLPAAAGSVSQWGFGASPGTAPPEPFPVGTKQSLRNSLLMSQEAQPSGQLLCQTAPGFLSCSRQGFTGAVDLQGQREMYIPQPALKALIKLTPRGSFGPQWDLCVVLCMARSWTGSLWIPPTQNILGFCDSVKQQLIHSSTLKNCWEINMSEYYF